MRWHLGLSQNSVHPKIPWWSWCLPINIVFLGHPASIFKRFKRPGPDTERAGSPIALTAEDQQTARFSMFLLTWKKAVSGKLWLLSFSDLLASLDELSWGIWLNGLNGLNMTSKLRSKIHHLHTLQRINKCTRKQRVTDVYIHNYISIYIYTMHICTQLYTYVYTCIYSILYINYN